MVFFRWHTEFLPKIILCHFCDALVEMIRKKSKKWHFRNALNYCKKPDFTRVLTNFNQCG